MLRDLIKFPHLKSVLGGVWEVKDRVICIILFSPKETSKEPLKTWAWLMEEAVAEPHLQLVIKSELSPLRLMSFAGDALGAQGRRQPDQ